MNLSVFVQSLANMDFERATVQGGIVRDVKGFSSPYIMKVLSLAMANLADEELYLEVGSHQGLTLIGALIDNNAKRAVAVDDFSGFAQDVSKQFLQDNLQRYGLTDRVIFFNESFEAFFKNRKEYTGKIGAYFYDGNHDTNVGLSALHRAVPYLASRAVIIMDDVSGAGVWASVEQFLHKYPRNAMPVLWMATPNFPVGHQFWHNGIGVLAWSAEPSVISLISGG